jgi:hypothetical protein
MTRLLAVPAAEMQSKIQKHKKRKQKSKTSESDSSRDSGGEA